MLLVSAAVEVDSMLPVLATDSRLLCNASSVIFSGFLPGIRNACASAMTIESISETCMLLRNLGRRESMLSPSSDSPSEEESDSMLVSPRSELARMLSRVRLLCLVRLVRGDTEECGCARDIGETGVLGLFNVEGRELL